MNFSLYLDRLASDLDRREIPVLQSSGSGKSRMVTEVLKTHLGILLNLRGNRMKLSITT